VLGVFFLILTYTLVILYYKITLISDQFVLKSHASNYIDLNCRINILLNADQWLLPEITKAMYEPGFYRSELMVVLSNNQGYQIVMLVFPENLYWSSKNFNKL
jgi:hypothetical protein